MAEYRTPLPGLLAASMEAAINPILDMDPQSDARLERMSGKCLRLDLEGLAITLYLKVAYQGIRVSLDGPEEPDTRVSGTPTALLSMAAGDEDGGWSRQGSRVRIEGDAGLARDFERLLSRLNPDWAAFFSGLTGDSIGPQLASGLQRGLAGGREAMRTGAGLLGDWLGGEGQVAVRPEEMQEFVRGVDDLRDAAERLQARMDRIGDPQ